MAGNDQAGGKGALLASCCSGDAWDSYSGCLTNGDRLGAGLGAVTRTGCLGHCRDVTCVAILGSCACARKCRCSSTSDVSWPGPGRWG